MELQKRFGKLTVVKLFHKSVECICDCGRNIKTSIVSLNSGEIISCGCLRNQKRETSLLKGLYLDKIIAPHKKSNSKNEPMTFEEFLVKSQKNCHYCNRNPSNVKRDKKKTNCNFRVEVFYSGIDRIDSALSYTSDNTVPCCKKCNFTKSDLPQSEFLCFCLEFHKYFDLDRGINEIKEDIKKKTLALHQSLQGL